MADVSNAQGEDTDTPQRLTDRVVILGAGFGGLAVAQQLQSSDVEIVVVDQRNHHTFQPLLYQVGSAGLDVGDTCYATRGIFHDQQNARAMQGRMIGLDVDNKRLFSNE